MKLGPKIIFSDKSIFFFLVLKGEIFMEKSNLVDGINIQLIGDWPTGDSNQSLSLSILREAQVSILIEHGAKTKSEPYWKGVSVNWAVPPSNAFEGDNKNSTR